MYIFAIKSAIALCLFAVTAGCTSINALNRTVDSLFEDRQEESRLAQEKYDQAKLALDRAAEKKLTTWSEAARRLRDINRSLAGKGNWRFDSYDEEYHAFCILAAQQLDIGRINFSYYDAMRTRKFNEIQTRRKQ